MLFLLRLSLSLGQLLCLFEGVLAVVRAPLEEHRRRGRCPGSTGLPDLRRNRKRVPALTERGSQSHVCEDKAFWCLQLAANVRGHGAAFAAFAFALTQLSLLRVSGSLQVAEHVRYADALAHGLQD